MTGHTWSGRTSTGRTSTGSWVAGLLAVVVLGSGGAAATQAASGAHRGKAKPAKPAAKDPRGEAPTRAPAGRLRRGVPYAALFTAAGQRHGVSPVLLAAVAKAETGFRPRLVSHAGAQGLMQIMPGTARGLGVDPFDPPQAVDGAARLLARHLRNYGGSVPLALAAYNAGQGAVAKYGGIPPYRETRNYVKRVQRYMRELQS